jgi:hypothetical protein
MVPGARRRDWSRVGVVDNEGTIITLFIGL